MSGNAINTGRVLTRRESFDEITAPYPAGFPVWDDDSTVVADPAEMLMTAQAMMFVDTGVVVLPKSEGDRLQKAHQPSRAKAPATGALASPKPERDRRQRAHQPGRAKTSDPQAQRKRGRLPG
jgi:hypothetical protein